jgi:hypothetical protein
VAIERSGVHDGVPYLVMEYVEGSSLRKEIRKGKLEVKRAIEIAGRVCGAIEFAHSKGVIHRDVKPENILLRPDGGLKIADFGLAKLSTPEELTLTQAAMGTPHYMAPEQLDPKSGVDERADLFSLGVVFYEMLTGQLPIGRFKPPSAFGTDLRVDSIVMDLLERDPEDRIPSAKELRRQLKRLDKRVALQAPPPEISSRRRDFPATFLAYGLFCLVSCLCTVVGSYLKGELSYPSHLIFPVGLDLAAATLALSVFLLIRMKWRPREGQTLAFPLAGLVLSCLMLGAAAHLHWTEFAFRLDDAWPKIEELPVFVRAYAKPEEDPDPLGHLQPVPPHADVDKVHRLVCADGRVEVLGLQFRSPTARRRWQEEAEKTGPGPTEPRRRTYRRAGGSSIILIIDQGQPTDSFVRDGLQKAIEVGIGRAIDREWSRPRELAGFP